MNYNIILFIGIFTIYIIALVTWIASMFMGAPYYPSKFAHYSHLKKYLKKGMKTADLGAGDGRVAIWMAMQGTSATAVEFNPFLTLIIRLRKIFAKVDVRVINKDLFTINYSDYDLVYLYLMPKILPKVEQKLFAEMKPGSYVVCNMFRFGDRIPEETIDDRIFVYKV